MASFSPCQPKEPNSTVLDVDEMPVYDRCACASPTPLGPRPPAYGKAPCCQRPERLHRRRVACILATGIIGTILVFDLTADRLTSALRRSQSEVLIVLLIVLTYLAGFVKGRRLSPRAGAAGHFRDETPGTRARKVAPPTKRQGQWEQLEVYRRLIQAARKNSLPCDTPTFSTLIVACARLNDAQVALELFDHMLKTGVHIDKESIGLATASKFFKIVAHNVDDERMQKDGSQLVRTMLAHGLEPSTQTQNQLIRSWKSKLPEHVVEMFVNLWEKGVHLSATAYRCIMTAHERSEPAFTLRLYDEMLDRGIKIDRVAFNAVMCACYHLGMADKALELFEHMSGYGLVPIGKTYGALIGVCTDAKRPEEALHFFESMRAAGFEPNCFAVRDAITCYCRLGKLEEAYELYKGMVRIRKIPCGSTYAYILEACQKKKCPWIADRIQADMILTRPFHASRVEEVNATSHAIPSDSASE
jgi:pentatricopeptide repeat protein